VSAAESSAERVAEPDKRCRLVEMLGRENSQALPSFNCQVKVLRVFTVLITGLQRAAQIADRFFRESRIVFRETDSLLRHYNGLVDVTTSTTTVIPYPQHCGEIGKNQRQVRRLLRRL
jgi:hypothetical protein